MFEFDKEWYTSKTMWSAIIIAGMSIFTAYTGQAIPEYVFLILGSVGLVGLRQAVDRLYA